VAERLRREVLSVSARVEVNPRSGRLELVVEGQGSNLAETRRALAWMTAMLTAPDWRGANLPRLPDLVDQSAPRPRRVMLGAEEGWQDNPRETLWRQSWLDGLHATSLLTRGHDAHRLRWMLRGDAASAPLAAYLVKTLAGAGQKLDRARLTELAAALAT